jgi:hypothetical protein
MRRLLGKGAANISATTYLSTNRGRGVFYANRTEVLDKPVSRSRRLGVLSCIVSSRYPATPGEQTRLYTCYNYSGLDCKSVRLL